MQRSEPLKPRTAPTPDFLGESFERFALCNSDQPALVFDGQCRHWLDVLQQRNAWLQFLVDSLPELKQRAPEFAAGPRVSWEAGNHAALPGLLIACAGAGIPLLMFDPRWSDELGSRICNGLRPALRIGRSVAEQMLQARQSAAPPVVLQPDQDAQVLVLFSSGTTSVPKAIVRSRRSWQHSISRANRVFGLEPGMHVAIPGPWCYSLSLFALVQALASGACSHGMSAFDAPTLSQLLADNNIDQLVAVPTMLSALLSQMPTSGPVDLHIITAGARLPPTLYRKLVANLPGARLSEYYGATETSFVSCNPAGEQLDRDSAGRLFPGVRISIRDDTGTELPAGQTGVIHVASDMLATTIFSEGDKPDAGGAGVVNASSGQLWQGRAVAAGDGFASVGDLGYVDTRGLLYLVDRLDDLIISGGQNVLPSVVEQCLLQLPAVADAVVLGLPDEHWGQIVCACVMPETAQELDNRQLAVHCRQHLPAHAVPKRFVEWADWPQTPGGKPSRKQLAALLVESDDA